MADTKVVHVSGVARPTKRMRRLASMMHGDRFATSLDSMMVDAIAIDALAGMLDRAFEAGLTKDGRIDLKVAAATLLGEIKANQK